MKISINMKKLIPLTILVIAVISLFSFGSTVLAYSCGVDSTGKPIPTSVDFGCDNSTTSGIGQIILYAINFLAIGVVIAVVGGIAWGGLTYARSDGEPAVAKEGIEIIKNAIIALVLFMFLWSGFNFLVPGGALDISGTKTKPLAEVPKLPPGTPITLADPTNPTNPVTPVTPTDPATPVTPTDPATPVLPPPDLSGSGSTFTIASWNTLYTNTTNVGSGAKSISANAQIIGFQELHRPAKRTQIKNTMLCPSCSYSGYIRDYTANGSTPSSVGIIWSKSLFNLVTSGYIKVSDAQSVSGCGGHDRISSKWITWVKLRETKTKKLLYVLNTHTVATVESGGQPSNAGCVRNFVNHMNVLTKKITSLRSENVPIFVTGDFNVNYRYDSKVQYKDFPYKRLGAVAVRSSWQRLNLAGISSGAGSHGSGSRIIDYVWSLDRSDIASISATISSSTYGSDHHPVYSTIKMFSDNQPSSL